MTNFKRAELTFEQAEAAAPLPSQMALKTVHPRLRARLWDAIYTEARSEMEAHRLNNRLGEVWKKLSRKYAVERLNKLADQLEGTHDEFVEMIKPAFESNNYIRTLGVTEWIARHSINKDLAKAVERILREEQCAYRLIDGSIIPIASEEEGAAILAAAISLNAAGFGGATQHLLKAGSLLTASHYADSIRESIHAVESVARTLTEEASLLNALKALSKKHPMHPALEKGFNSIYGYTSDANGVRHPIVGDDGPLAGEDEAIFMLGACASFVTYLLRIGK